MAEAEYFSGAGAFMAPTPAEVRDLDVATIEQKEEAPDEQKLFMARMFGPAKETAESSAIELEAAPVEVARVETAPVATAMTPDPSMRLLSPLEMDFLLAQAKIAGGNVAEPRNVAGFAPAPIEESAEGGRSEIAFLFPDRAAYDVFVTRLRIMPLDDLGQSPRSDRAVASGSGVGGDISRRQRSGMPAGIGQPNGTTPSPVTGFASSQPAPAVSRQESRTASGITPSVPETSASTATLPEGLAFGQPIDLTRYHFHLTTDFESGTLRLNLRPVQPGEKPGGPPSPRTATPVPGARR
jgi:hypothetical protein